MLTSSGIIEAPDLVQRGSQYVLVLLRRRVQRLQLPDVLRDLTSLSGPWTTAYRPLMTTATFDNHVCGPGGADFVGDKVFLHGWVNGGRHLYVADVGWANDYPVVRGSRVRYEAERGTLNHCSGPRRTRPVPRTGRWSRHRLRGLVGGELRVRPGGRRLHAVRRVRQRYRRPPRATGWLSTATPGLGQLPGHRLGQLAQSSVPVTLNAGWNTIRLTKGDLYAEVDYLEVQ